MALENPVLLITAQPLLAELLTEHLSLPVPYVLRHCASITAPALMIVDSESSTDWKNAVSAAPEVPWFQMGGVKSATANKHFAYPFRLAALENALLASLPHLAPESAPIELGEHISFSLEQRLLSCKHGSQPGIALTQKEAELLDRLLKGDEITREALLAEIWGYRDNAASHTVETHLYRLRQKLKKIGAEDVRIEAQNGMLRLSMKR